MNTVKLTTKQEQFVLNVFSGMPQREAYLKAGYSSNTSMAVIDVQSSRLSKNAKVLLRLEELRQKVASDKIMEVRERKERLSEIARGRLTDYQESGQDGGWINIGPESPNTAALGEIVSTTKYDENGAKPTLITRIKLHNPIVAIAELNKMERIYEAEGTVTIDNRTLVINVISDKAKGLTERLMEGERTSGDNDHKNL